MKLPLSWLKDFVDIELSINELAYALTSAGMEVEAIHFAGLPLPQSERLEYQVSGFEWERDKLVVAAIREVMPHPDADRLVLCQLDDGERLHTVLTGAPNLFEYKGLGALPAPLKVCYAREGAQIYDGHQPGRVLMRLKRTKIRGVASYSMVCSEKELGISEEHDGIILLDADAPLGAPLQDYLGDAVFEIAITPNIARNANVYGIAREIAAITGKPLRAPDLSLVAEGAPLEGRVSIEITHPPANPRFVVGLIEAVTIKPSPYKIQHRLRLAGQRPINNIVDATNYAMLEIGQPLHAFDYDVLLARAKTAGAASPIIITRPAQPGETLTTLDGMARRLDDFTILVCDQAGSLALAGVMGGLESEVTAATQNVLLEGAAWNPINTRRTVKAQNLPSEAAYRFSRGVHPALAPRGVARGLELMRQWGGGVVARGLVDEYPLPAADPVVELTPADVERWLGIALPAADIARLLESLGFHCQLSNLQAPITITVTTPDHRLDIGTGVIGKADLIEEIARLYGYHRIPETRLADTLPPQRGNPSLALEERVRDLLVAAGLQEVITYRMTTPEAEARRLPPGTPPTDKPYLQLANPINAERTVLRQSLLAGVLEIVERNARLRERVALFEIGEVFLGSEGGGASGTDALPDELPRLVIALTGRRALPAWQGADDGMLDFYDLKGIVETLLDGLHLPAQYEPGAHPSFHPGKCAHVVSGEQRIGTIGALHPEVAARYDLGAAPVLVARFDVAAMAALTPAGYATRGVPAFPPIVEDLAIIVEESIPAERVAFIIRQTGGKLLEGAGLFDVYRGPQLGAGLKSLAYRLTYQAEDRTLTDADVAKVRHRIVTRLERELGAKLRG
jgi:phenylalanyl-tRNA synthetase beta chain